MNYTSVFVQRDFLLWLLAILIQTVGMTLFGLALMRANALPRWNGLPLLIGFLSGLTRNGKFMVET